MYDMSIRQNVWNAAFEALEGQYADAHDMATRIADRFAEIGRNRRSSRAVPEETRKAIKHDLISGYWTYTQIRQRNSVGTSTIQRIARELRERGTTVHTVGSRNSGRHYSHTRHRD